MGFWDTAEGAIYTWAHNALQAANGGTPIPVFWADQSNPRPPTAFATLKRLGTVVVGSVDEVQLRHNPAGSPPAGQELEYDTNAQREFVVSLQVFTSAVYGDSAASSLIQFAQTSLGMDSYGDTLRAAGLTVANKGSVQNLTGLLETKYEGRAALDVRFRAGIPATDFGGYIATANTTGTFNP